MLNQRLLAGLLAVTTVATTVAVNVSASYANNSINVQKIAQIDGMDWNTYARYLKDLYDLYDKFSKFGIPNILQQAWEEANKMIKRGLGDQTVPSNQVRELRNNLKASDFTTPEMKDKLRNLRNNLYKSYDKLK